MDINIRSRALLNLADECLNGSDDIFTPKERDIIKSAISRYELDSNLADYSSPKYNYDTNSDYFESCLSKCRTVSGKNSPVMGTCVTNEEKFLDVDDFEAEKLKPLSPNKYINSSPHKQASTDLLNKYEALEKQLKEEREIRYIITQQFSRLISSVTHKTVTTKESTRKNILSMLDRLGSASARISTARLLNQEVDSFISDLDLEEQIPNKTISKLSHSSKDAKNISHSLLVRGCNELIESLMNGFIDRNCDVDHLVDNPVEFARHITEVKRIHDIGISELRTTNSFLKERVSELEKMEAKGDINNETYELVNDLLAKMTTLSNQTKREYDDLRDHIRG